MLRHPTTVILALGISLAAGDLAAQQAPARRIGFGFDYAGSVYSTNARGNYLGPTLGVELGSRGPLRLRADASLQLEAGTNGLKVVNPNVPDGGGAPVTYDGRPLKGLGTATIGLEAGTRGHLSTGGIFAAARIGGGAGRWGPGTVDYRMSPTWVFSYRDPGFTAAVVTVGAEAGIWIPLAGRLHRIAVRVDGVHTHDFSTSRLAVIVLRH